MTAYIRKIGYENMIVNGQSESQVFTWICQSVINILGENFNNKDCALYVSCVDLAVSSSIQFWREALQNGYAFASPRDFPLTLANALASKLAINLGVTGPNVTFVGDANVQRDAYIQGLLDFEIGAISQCLVVNVQSIDPKNQKLCISVSHLHSHIQNKGSSVAAISLRQKQSENELFLNIETALHRLSKDKHMSGHYFIETDIQRDICLENIEVSKP